MSVNDRIESLLQKDIKVTREMKQAETRMNARTALLKQELRELSRPFEEDLDRLGNKRKEIRAKILVLWKKHYDKETTITFPSAKVSRRNYRELVIHDKIALLNALDRIGRIDLVEYVFTENEVAKLYDNGKLKGIDPRALDVTDHHNLQVRAKRNK